MTKRQAIERALSRLRDPHGGDYEAAHIAADQALLEYLDATGAKEVADAFRKAAAGTANHLSFRYA